MTRENKAQTVIHRSKHDKKKSEDIAKEPEMKRLKELLDTGQVSPDRLDQYIKNEEG